MHVVIDTSVLRQDPRREKAAIRGLERLASGRKITVHFPQFVREEFVSQQTAELGKRLKDIDGALSAIARSVKGEELDESADRIKGDISEFGSGALVAVGTEFEKWVEHIHGTIHPIADSHGRRVMQAYFDGTPPFKAPKNRLDIPDSFIWECMLDLQAKYEVIHVISADGALSACAQSHPGMISYDSLETFVQSEACQQALQEIAAETVSRNMRRAEELLSEAERLLRAEVEAQLVGELDGKDVKGRNIPDDNNEAVVVAVNEPDQLSFDFEDVDYFGEGELGIAFAASIVCTLNYAIFKSDYYCLSDEKAEGISIDERNDHYYDADEEYTLEVSGRVLVSMAKDDLERELTDEQILELIESADFNLEVSDIEVEGGAEF